MKRILCLSVVLAVFLMVFSATAMAQQKYDLKLTTGPMGGSWYPLGGAISDAIQKSIPGTAVSVIPGGGVGNVVAVEFGKADLGFSNSSSAVDGVHGRAPFKTKITKMRQVANLYPQYFQMIVMADSDIKSVADLKGKVISPGPKGHTGEFVSRQVLSVYGLSYKDMSKVHHVGYNDTVSLMKDGHCDAWLFCSTAPASAAIDLSSTRKIRLISLPEDKIKEMQKLNGGYGHRVVKKGTYMNVDYDVQGFGFYSHLIATKDLPDGLVYSITKVMVENLPRFATVVKAMQGVTAKDLADDVGVPYHPGALKYYKEIGAIK
jgi:uncharacterized protein